MKKIILLFCVFALWGCASAPNSALMYAAHVAKFNLAQPHTVHTVKRSDGYSLQAREFNAAKKGQSPTLVMMHGFPDNQHLYDRLIPQLAQHHHIVSFDFLGWGASDKPPAHVYDVASQRLDLEAVVKQLGLGQVVLIVHDLSGPSGIDWALDHEGQTAALVLLNTYYSPMATLLAPEAISFYATPGWLRDIAVWGATKSGINFQNGVGKQLARFFSNAQIRDEFIPVITNAAVSIRPAFFSATSVLWQELEARRAQVPRVQRFTKPVYIIFGADDPYLNTGVAQDFKRLFSHSSIDLVPQAGHYVQLDRADEVGRILRDKLSPHSIQATR